MVINKLQNNLPIVAIKAPIFNSREYLKDISVFTGATFISEEEQGLKIEKCDPVYVLGKCQKASISKDQTILINGDGKSDLITSRIEYLQKQFSDELMLGDFD